MDPDDDFDFSDDGLDELPADALDQLETTAIHATQHQHQSRSAAPESDYGADDGDGDEVINLDDQTAAPQPATWGVAAAQPGNAPPQQYDYSYGNESHPQNGYVNQNDHGIGYGNNAYTEVMQVEEQPQRSQVDVNQLLLRIKKVCLQSDAGPTLR